MTGRESNAGRSPERVVHELKTWPPFFRAVKDGTKTFEVRRNDRGFQKGDVLLLREWRPGPEWGGGVYTGDKFLAVVSYVLSGFDGVEDGFVVMGLRNG